MNIPILRDFNFNEIPRGFAQIIDDKLIMKFKDGFDCELYDIAPAFIIKDHDREGLVTEAELVSLSLVLKPSTRARQEKIWYANWLEKARRANTCCMLGCTGKNFPYCTQHDVS